MAGMNDDQLYSLIMAMNPPPQASIPGGAVADAYCHIALAETTALCASSSALHLNAGATERQAPVSVEDAKRAIQSAKAAIGAKATPRSEQVSGSPSNNQYINCTAVWLLSVCTERGSLLTVVS